MSDADKAKHKGEELVGKGKEAVGDATGDDQLRGEGQADRVSGQAKQKADGLKGKATGFVNQAKRKLGK